MEKRPVVIEGTFEDVVRRFHTEMQKGKKNFSYCGENAGGKMHRIKRWCVCMKDIFCIQISLLRSQYFLKS